MSQVVTLAFLGGGGIVLAVLLFKLATRRSPVQATAVSPSAPPVSRPPASAPTLRESAVVLNPRGSAATLLVVDDDQAVRVTTAMILQDSGYSVLTCSSGQSALDLLGEQPAVALLLTDVVMPVMNGAELARRARAMRASLPIVFFSGYADPNSAAGEAVLEPLLRKPFRASELVAEIEAALSGARVAGAVARGGT
jgi:CheY-like chemotaxis protein